MLATLTARAARWGISRSQCSQAATFRRWAVTDRFESISNVRRLQQLSVFNREMRCLTLAAEGVSRLVLVRLGWLVATSYRTAVSLNHSVVAITPNIVEHTCKSCAAIGLSQTSTLSSMAQTDDAPSLRVTRVQKCRSVCPGVDTCRESTPCLQAGARVRTSGFFPTRKHSVSAGHAT